MRLENKVAVVTGAGRGIGRAIAMRLAEEGARVVVSDIEASFAASVVLRITEAGGDAVPMAVNVTDGDQVEIMFEEVADRFGEIHILVNNAGSRKDVPLHNLTEDQWDQAMVIQTKGSFNCTRAVQKYMVRQNYGKIVNLSAPVPASLGEHGQTGYATASSAMWGFTRALALELGRHNTNVNCVAPDFVDTMMTRELAKRKGLYLSDVEKFAIAQVPLRRMGTPDDVANVVLFLVSDEASFVSGQVIYVKGGP
ncbi:MAG: 3-oxoacyl-ACP reductase FabG [Deltaproteobacteria bacterium]|nr:3-oxoacyl-ACP reductase FabG [Deltaproteobacteria bacterium]MBW2200733.1 3-oxoacyl-ACP reductase FabG [Deltaproteobacteria bacterium]